MLAPEDCTYVIKCVIEILHLDNAGAAIPTRMLDPSSDKRWY